MIELKTFPDAESMSRAAAERVIALARAADDARGRFSLALSGGRTPRRLYELLSGADLPWERVHFFWGDERCVPRGDAASNFRLASDAWLSRVPARPENVHAMPCDPATPEAGAQAYEDLLRGFFHGSDASFDLVLLGLGPDGHTASLFPGEPALAEASRWVAVSAGRSATPPVARLTLTFPGLAAAREALFLAEGAEKRTLVEAAAGGGADFPAARVRPRGGVSWYWSETESRSDGARKPI
jgi:6-phosphogluconolactonase